MQVRERFSPKPMAADATLEIPGTYLGGFLATVSGTLSVVAKDSLGENDVTLVDAVPVTAGIYTPIPIVIPAANSYTVTLAGGAAGTLMV